MPLVLAMKIKPLNKASKKNKPQWWLLPDPIKKMGRLSQLNKHNHRVDSELVRAAKLAEGNE